MIHERNNFKMGTVEMLVLSPIITERPIWL